MKYWAYVVMGLLIISGAFAKAAYGQEEWYAGEGTEKGLLVKYRISHYDYKAGEQFDATIWFGEQDDKKNWITDVIIEEQGRIVTSKMTLSALNLSPVGFDVSEDFKPYRAAIKGSLGWLGEYASKIEPKPITGDKAWGIVGAIGGGGIIVAHTGTETIQAAGQSWDTSIIGFHYAADSKVWVKDGFPLPIKAKVYTIASTQPLPLQFEFTLLETRISETTPVPPEEEVVLPTPPLTKPTTSGGFSVDLYWDPITIEPGKPTKIGVVIFDKQKNVIKDAQYDMLITDANGKVVADIKKFTTTEGQGTHEVTFDSTGRTHVTVTYLGSLSGFEHKIRETAEFDLIVVPEFPLGIAAVMAAIVAMMIATTRLKKISIPKL